ncbi:MAG TPA: S9 family peptidase [Phototrophicaceae bacterium]|nr:S9 family peptidase [Phototrophicaceae bacterium]
MGEQQRPLEPADLFRLKFVTGARLSPDGKQVAYTVTHVDAEQEKEFSAIWLTALDSGETRQLTNGRAKDTNPQWSFGGDQLAFVSTRDDKAQLYVIPVDGGEARAITSLKQGVGGTFAWSPDDTQIAFSAVPIEEARDPAKPYRLTRTVYRFDALEYLDDVVQSLYLIDLSGGAARRLTNDGMMNTEPQWSPDGKEILFTSTMQPDSAAAILPSLRVIDVDSGAVREIVSGWDGVGSAGWTPDGGRIVFSGTPPGKLIGTKADLWVIDRAGGTPECRTAGLNVGVEGTVQGDQPVGMAIPRVILARDGQSAYERVQIGGTVHIYKIALTGDESWTPLLTGERTTLLTSADSEHLLYLATDINHPVDLYISKIDGSDERQITHLNDHWRAGITFPQSKHLLFPGSDGVQVEGWLLTPPTGQAPYPTILFIHGGPHIAFGNAFHFDMQMLAGAGFAVLLVNHRASTGYGDAFSTAIKGDWGNLDYLDLMAGVDHVIAQGWADADRLGVCGRSGGGNLTCWIVGQTERFKAAAPENPVTNWQSFYGTSDVGLWFAVEQLGGRPHEIPDVYARCSPITYAHRCTTPTLLIQGEHDWRCPAEQSEQFYATLKASGCIVEMLRMPNSPHGGAVSGPIAVRKAHNDALLDWMRRYVLGE